MNGRPGKDPEERRLRALVAIGSKLGRDTVVADARARLREIELMVAVERITRGADRPLPSEIIDQVHARLIAAGRAGVVR